MTTEERAELILKPYHKDCAPIWNDLERAIAAAIRDAVAEAEKAAFQKARTAAAIEGGQAITPMLDQARAALEPFALVGATQDHPKPIERRLALFTKSQLRAARDAYLALGGKPLDN